MKKPQAVLRVGSCRLGNDRPLVFIAGPCVAESEALVFRTARALKAVSRRLRAPLIFKCSYDKANRTSPSSFRGLGVREGMSLLYRVGKETGLPVLTDVHAVSEVPAASSVAEVLQIPAFLCRQTDLIQAAARTGRVVNVKKGQFLAPGDVRNIIDKVRAAGSRQVMLTERGTSFGYNNLVVDMRGLEIMKSYGCPVVFDATHSVQLPGGQGKRSGGQREFVYPLARAAVAVGVAAVFLEVHPRPERALSDGPNAVRLRDVPELMRRLMALDRQVKKEKRWNVR